MQTCNHLACVGKDECVDVRWSEGCPHCGHAMSGHLGGLLGGHVMRAADGAPQCSDCIGGNYASDPGGAAQCFSSSDPAWRSDQHVQMWQDRLVRESLGRAGFEVPA